MQRDDGILKIMVIGFLLIFLGNAIEYFFVTRSSLKKISGRVSEVNLETYDCMGYTRYRKSVCEKTIIRLENVKGSFNVSDYTDRGASLDMIEKGDEVSIYIRKWYQYILSVGSGKDIYRFN